MLFNIHSTKGSRARPSKFEAEYSYCTFREMVSMFPNEIHNVVINSSADAAYIILEESDTIPAQYLEILYQELERGSKTALRKDLVDLYVLCESAKEKLIELL